MLVESRCKAGDEALARPDDGRVQGGAVHVAGVVPVAGFELPDLSEARAPICDSDFPADERDQADADALKDELPFAVDVAEELQFLLGLLAMRLRLLQECVELVKSHQATF